MYGVVRFDGQNPHDYLWLEFANFDEEKGDESYQCFHTEPTIKNISTRFFIAVTLYGSLFLIVSDTLALMVLILRICHP